MTRSTFLNVNLLLASYKAKNRVTNNTYVSDERVEYKTIRTNFTLPTNIYIYIYIYI